MSRQISKDDLQAIDGLLSALVALVKNRAIYGDDHPRLQETRIEYRQQCEASRELEFIANDMVVVACRNNRLYLENVPLPRRSIPPLMAEKLRGDRAGFALRLSLSDPQVDPVLEHLAPGRTDDGTLPNPDHFRWLSHDDLVAFEIGKQRQVRNHLVLNIPELHVEKEHYERAMNELASFTEACAVDDLAELTGVEESARKLVDQMLDSPEEILPLTTIPYYDEFTYFHSVNVCLLALITARMVITDEQMLMRISRAALLHDVGKARIPSEVLYKNGRLDEAERKIIMEHPVTGARILQEHPGIDALAVNAAFGHHIKDDGGGYPKTIPSYRIGPVTALIEVVDIFEALTAMRPYKKPMTAAQAFEVLYSMPGIDSLRPYIDLLYNAVGNHPVGSRVRTADGELGVVCGHHEGSPDHSIVRIVKPDATGDVSAEVVVVGTSEPSSELSETTIVTALDPENDFVDASLVEW